MKTKIFILFIVFSGCHLSLALFGSNISAAAESENGIVFSGGYHPVKQKWRGPYHNKLLFPWFCSNTKAENEKEYKRLIDDQRKNGVKFIGYYYSSTTSSPQPAGESTVFPEMKIPLQAIKYSWIVRDAKNQLVTWPSQKDRFFLDVGLKDVQDAILTRCVGNAKQLGANVLFLDNWYHKYWAPGDMKESQWTEKCLSFLMCARELTQYNNLKLVVNTSSPPQYWIGFASFLDGIAYEMAAHPNRLKTRNAYEQELNGYEKVMKMGKSVFLYTDTLSHNDKRWDKDGRKVAATAMLVMPKDQPYWGGIYVCPPRFEVWPVGGWPMWPKQLGKPLSPRQWNGNTVTRKFEHSSITVTVGQNPKFSITLEY